VESKGKWAAKEALYMKQWQEMMIKGQKTIVARQRIRIMLRGNGLAESCLALDCGRGSGLVGLDKGEAAQIQF
jgi:hypothetical protein